MPRTLQQHFAPNGQKRILALDGGGVRGVLSLAFLERIEKLLAERAGSTEFRLSDYYDLIGGTSTGAIIGTGLALGYRVTELIQLYCDLSSETFRDANLLGGLFAPKFRTEPLMRMVQQHVGTETLGSSRLRTGLAVVAKRLDTNSVWVFHNNPHGKYFDSQEKVPTFTPNRDLPLTSIIRASTAAPTYFAPEIIAIAPGVDGAFVDGGVSPHNNPALLMLMVAGISGYGFNWPLGADRLMITSVGTGTYNIPFDRNSMAGLTGMGVGLTALRSLMTDTATLVETMMQWMGACANPWRIDSQIGDLSSDRFGGSEWFQYQRYNVELSLAWLKRHLGLDLPAKSVARLAEIDRVEVIQELLDIGRRAAEIQVSPTHLPE